MDTTSVALSSFAARLALCALAASAASSASLGQCGGYAIASSTGGVITPGASDTGNHGDDLATALTLPFTVSLYGNWYNAVQVVSNGSLQFTTAGSNPVEYANECLAAPTRVTGVTLFPLWDDLRTDVTIGGVPGGVYTSVTGTPGSRVFNVEWRASYYGNDAARVSFEVRLFEDQSRIEFVYGDIPDGGASATIGVQSAPGTFTQFSCNAAGVSSGRVLTLTPTGPAAALCAAGGVSPARVNSCGGGPALMMVHVSPATSPASTGVAVAADLSAVGGAAAAPMYDDGTHGDAAAGDGTYSLTVGVPAGVPVGTRTLGFGVSDGQGRTAAGTVGLIVNCVTPPNPAVGPDVAVWAITDVIRWGTNAAGSVTSYSVGTTSVNVGDYPVLWVDGSPSYLPDYNSTEQPAISQNMYRLRSYGGYSRFEQLGQSWLKHGFVSTNSGGGPGACVANTQVWSYSTQTYRYFSGDALGINCLDTYGAGLNGSQGGLGPKSIVNATTGYSPHTLGGGNDPDTVTNERLQVPTSDVTGQPAGTRYFVDGCYVTQDDAQFVRPGEAVARNALNNASWSELTAATILTTPALTGGTRRYEPGIFAWKSVDPGVTLVSADHDDCPNPGTGYRDINGDPGFPGSAIRSRYWLAAKATALGGGLYRYEYAVYNHNSDRSAGAFTAPLPVGAALSDVSFHAPQWHSGEPYSNAPWGIARSSTGVTFSTEAYGVNPNANALRWANTFNFGFTTDASPTTGAVSLDLFKPGAPGAPSTVAVAGVPVPATPAQCGPADMGRQGGLAGQDGQLDNNDFVVMINFFFANDGRADLGQQGGLVGADGQFDNNDFIVFINLFFAGC